MRNNDGKYEFYQDEENTHVWWVDNSLDVKGIREFTFDKSVIFNLYEDYPDKLTPEQKQIFDREEPFWADYFKART